MTTTGAAGLRAVVVAAVLCLGACDRVEQEGLPYYRTRDLTPEWVSASTAASARMHRIPAFSVRNQHGEVVTDRVLAGRVTLVHFFYASCGRVCPRAFGSIQRLVRTVARDTMFQVLSYTVQPDRDTVAALAAYAQRNAITDPRWQLLTAPWDDVADLAVNGYFVNLRDGASYGTDDLAHTETLVLIDQAARIRGVYNATLALDMAQIVRDVATLERAGGVGHRELRRGPTRLTLTHAGAQECCHQLDARRCRCASGQ